MKNLKYFAIIDDEADPISWPGYGLCVYDSLESLEAICNAVITKPYEIFAIESDVYYDL